MNIFIYFSVNNIIFPRKYKLVKGYSNFIDLATENMSLSSSQHHKLKYQVIVRFKIGGIVSIEVGPCLYIACNTTYCTQI